MPRTGLRQRANRGRPRVLARPGATLSVRGESKPGADHGVQPQDARVPRWIWIMGLRKGTIRHPAPPVRRFERQSVHGGSNAAETGEQTGPEVRLHRFCTDADGNQKQVKTPSPKTLAISCKSGLGDCSALHRNLQFGTRAAYSDYPPLNQNKYFSANCTIRGSLAAMTFPKKLLFRSKMGFIMLKLLKTLNASARNSTFCISRTWNVLERERSNCHNPGPLTLPIPLLPHVPNAGCANAAELKNFPGVRSPYGFPKTWLTRSLISIVPPVPKFGNWRGKSPVSDRSRLVTIVIASPLKIFTIGEMRQLDATARVTGFAKPGVAATADKLKIWRRSSAD